MVSESRRITRPEERASERLSYGGFHQPAQVRRLAGADEATPGLRCRQGAHQEDQSRVSVQHRC